jgi:predicted HTH transcriptional regulator
MEFNGVQLIFRNFAIKKAKVLRFGKKKKSFLCFALNFSYLCSRMDDKKYLQRLINEGEHQQQDFKYRVSDALKLAKSVSAFANTDGGRLLIGVRDDGQMSGVRSEEEIYMMHQAAYRYCRPEASIKFDTFHIEGRTIVIATVPPSDKRPVCVVNADDKPRAYIRIADENIVASPVHLALWRESQKPQGTVLTYNDDMRKLLDIMQGRQTLNQIVRQAKLPRPKVVALLARLIRFGTVKWEYADQQFYFSLT